MKDDSFGRASDDRAERAFGEAGGSEFFRLLYCEAKAVSEDRVTVSAPSLIARLPGVFEKM